MKLKFLVTILLVLVGGFSYLVLALGFEPEMLTKISFYLDLANPSVKVVKVEEGLRKEQIAEIVGNKLGWNEKEKVDFINAHLARQMDDLEGKYFPKTYLLGQDDGPATVTETMLTEFEKATSKIVQAHQDKIINEDSIVKIASIIQREAAGKKDMDLISGVIWNRLWAGMKLQMDATLQYAKGSEEDGWWPKVDPADKKIESEYNTYMYKGLPPGPIANPGIEAIKAAYNPAKTSCMFYLHDKKGRFHCSKTYEEHKAKIKEYL